MDVFEEAIFFLFLNGFVHQSAGRRSNLKPGGSGDGTLLSYVMGLVCLGLGIWALIEGGRHTIAIVSLPMLLCWAFGYVIAEAILEREHDDAVLGLSLPMLPYVFWALLLRQH